MMTPIDKLKTISTTCISDALDYFGINGAINGIRPIEPSMHMAGRAFTVKYVLDEANTFTSTTNYPDKISENDVIIIDNDGRDFCTVWGEMLTLAAMRSKATGVIVNGCCRDVDAIPRLKFPTFSRSIHMRTGKNRVRVEFIQKPIIINGIVISPGDFIRADINGIIIIPKNHIEIVAKLALALDENDRNILTAINNGMTLAAAKSKHQYDIFAKHFMENQG